MADVDHMDLRAVEVQLVADVEQGRRQDEFDAIEVIVLQQLESRGRETGVDGLEGLASGLIGDAVQQIPELLRIGDLLHPLGNRPVGDDLRVREKLIAPDVVPVLVRNDDAFRHGRPHRAEQLDHLPRMGLVRLRVDHHAAPQIDETRVRIAHPVLLVQNRKTVVAYLLHFHDTGLLLRTGSTSLPEAVSSLRGAGATRTRV